MGTYDFDKSKQGQKWAQYSNRLKDPKGYEKYNNRQAAKYNGMPRLSKAAQSAADNAAMARGNSSPIKDQTHSDISLIQSKSSTVPGKPASAGNGDAVRAAQSTGFADAVAAIEDQVVKTQGVDALTPPEKARYEARTAGKEYRNRDGENAAQAARTDMHRARMRQEQKQMRQARTGGGTGQGRGNWGHAGRPGERGGSA